MKIKIEKKHRPSFEKINAPYRGVSSKDDFVNAVHAITHDLVYTQIKSGGKEGKRGHQQQIDDNFTLLYAGEGERETATLPSAGVYSKIIEPANISQDLSSSVWTFSNGVVKTKSDNKITLNEKGLVSPAYLSGSLPVKLGEIIYIRFKGRVVEGDGKAFYVGVDNLNSEGEFLKHIELTSEMKWHDLKIYSNQSQLIDLRFYLHKLPEQLAKTTIEIDSLEIMRMEETNCSIAGISDVLNKELSVADNKIEFLKRNVKGGK